MARFRRSSTVTSKRTAAINHIQTSWKDAVDQPWDCFECYNASRGENRNQKEFIICSMSINGSRRWRYGCPERQHLHGCPMKCDGGCRKHTPGGVRWRSEGGSGSLAIRWWIKEWINSWEYQWQHLPLNRRGSTEQNPNMLSHALSGEWEILYS